MNYYNIVDASPKEFPVGAECYLGKINIYAEECNTQKQAEQEASEMLYEEAYEEASLAYRDRHRHDPYHEFGRSIEALLIECDDEGIVLSTKEIKIGY